MRLIIFLSLLLLAVGCKKNFPSISQKERCTIAFTETEIIQGREFYQGICRCSQYTWTESFIGKVGSNYNKDIKHCDRMSGYNPDETAEIYNWQEAIRLWLIRLK